MPKLSPPPLTSETMLDRWLNLLWKKTKAGEVFDEATTTTTVGAAGGASALPATPLGYVTTVINGVTVKMPYYSP